MKQILLFLMGASLSATYFLGTLQMVAPTFISFAIFSLLLAIRVAIGKIEGDMGWFGRIMIFVSIVVATIFVSIFLPVVFGWR